MGKPQRFTKLTIPSDGIKSLTSKVTLSGASVIGDILNGDGTRTLVFERPEPAAKPHGARRKHRRTQAQAAAAMLEEASNG